MKRRQKERLKKLLPNFVIGAYHHCRIALRNARFVYARQFHKGTGFYCGLCKTHYRRFLPDGSKLPVISRLRIASAGYRPNCICPNCQSKDRDRLLYLFFNKRTDLFDGKLKKLLHFAPEPALKKLFQSQSYIQYRNADLNPDLADEQMDITNIPVASNSIDYIVCNHVLEHIPDDAKAMRELYRILKKGGKAVLQVPLALNLKETYENPAITDPHERETHFGQFDHVRVYGSDYTKRLENAGFRCLCHFSHRFFKCRIHKIAVLVKRGVDFLVCEMMPRGKK